LSIKLVIEASLYYDARSEKHHIFYLEVLSSRIETIILCLWIELSPS